MGSPDGRDEAADTIHQLIEKVTIFPTATAPEAEVAADSINLIAFAQTRDGPQGVNLGGRSDQESWSSIALVAGTGFEPVTFRL